MGKNINVKGGRNIRVERKENDFIIHGAPHPAAENCAGKGFFKVRVEKHEKIEKAVATISDCIFRLNGKYCKLDDYVIDSWYEPWNFIYLKLSNDGVYPCTIERYAYSAREDAEIFDSPEYILLHILHKTAYSVEIEEFAAGGMIDTVYLGCGFVYALEDNELHSTVTRNWRGDKHTFDDTQGDIVYIPCFHATKREAVNIIIDANGGGLLQPQTGENYYYWNTTGLPQRSDEVITVKINHEKVYF